MDAEDGGAGGWGGQTGGGGAGGWGHLGRSVKAETGFFFGAVEGGVGTCKNSADAEDGSGAAERGCGTCGHSVDAEDRFEALEDGTGLGLTCRGECSGCSSMIIYCF